MARIWRWTVCAGALGVLPLLLAYGIRYYHAPETPPLGAVMASGDAYVIAMAWCATALVDLTETAGGRRRGLTALATGVLTLSAVAYGCLTADSVTGGVQTRRQQTTVTRSSLILLGLAAVSGMAGSLAAGRTRREER